MWRGHYKQLRLIYSLSTTWLFKSNIWSVIHCKIVKVLVSISSVCLSFNLHGSLLELLLIVLLGGFVNSDCNTNNYCSSANGGSRRTRLPNSKCSMHNRFVVCFLQIFSTRLKWSFLCLWVCLDEVKMPPYNIVTLVGPKIRVFSFSAHTILGFLDI
jgi:hypothetical protein